MEPESFYSFSIRFEDTAIFEGEGQWSSSLLFPLFSC